MPYIENKPFDELDIGDSASISHTLTRRDIQLFAAMSGDVNPQHVDEAYAKSEMFHDIIGHGMWTASLISTVLGTQLPGPGTIYLDQSLRFLRPVKLGDTITAQVTVKEKRAEHQHVVLICCCVNQHGKEVVAGEALVKAPTKKVRRERTRVPKVEVHDGRPPFYETLISMQEALPPMRTAVVHPVEKLSLEGALEAANEQMITPVLVGPEERIRAAADGAGLDIAGMELVATRHSHEAAAVSVQMAREGKVDALMKGHIHTDELMKAIIHKERGLRTGRRMSHIFAVDIETYPKPLFLTDAALNIHPNLSQKRDIVQNAIDLFLALGLGTPKVAIVSAVETVNEAIPSTLDATALCKMADRGQITGGLLDGPLAFDNAISHEAAEAKHIVSPVAGDADIIVVPDLESGNMLYKQMRFLSGAEAAGIVVGAQVPIILTSRAGGLESRLASCALALLYASRQP